MLGLDYTTIDDKEAVLQTQNAMANKETIPFLTNIEENKEEEQIIFKSAVDIIRSKNKDTTTAKEVLETTSNNLIFNNHINTYDDVEEENVEGMRKKINLKNAPIPSILQLITSTTTTNI